MCNGIFFLWQNFSSSEEAVASKVTLGTGINSGEVNQLVLLSELSAGELSLASESEAGEAAIAQEAALVSEPVEEMCWLIGPFKERVSGRQVVGRLEALDISLQLREIEFQGESDYWVHIAPQVSRQAAIKLLRELQSKKIDSFLIGEGELQNGISLGFFTQSARAKDVYEQRVAQGYAAEIKVVPRVYTELWAVFNAGESRKFSDALWEKIKEGNKDLERRKNYCDRIASVDNLE
jgi:hypothetical protein